MGGGEKICANVPFHLRRSKECRVLSLTPLAAVIELWESQGRKGGAKFWDPIPKQFFFYVYIHFFHP